jgi:hypothetical protein
MTLSPRRFCNTIHAWATARLKPEELDAWKLDLLAPLPGITRPGKVEQALVDAEMEMLMAFKQKTTG